MALKRACQLAPGSPDEWRLLADQFDLAGEALTTIRPGHAIFRPRSVTRCSAPLRLRWLQMTSPSLMRTSRHLATHPTDVAALRMRAEVAARLRRYADAERLLATCLELAPSFDAARHNYAVVLNRQGKAAEALPEVDALA